MKVEVPNPKMPMPLASAPPLNQDEIDTSHQYIPRIDANNVNQRVYPMLPYNNRAPEGKQPKLEDQVEGKPSTTTTTTIKSPSSTWRRSVLKGFWLVVMFLCFLALFFYRDYVKQKEMELKSIKSTMKRRDFIDVFANEIGIHNQRVTEDLKLQRNTGTEKCNKEKVNTIQSCETRVQSINTKWKEFGNSTIRDIKRTLTGMASAFNEDEYSSEFLRRLETVVRDETTSLAIRENRMTEPESCARVFNTYYECERHVSSNSTLLEETIRNEPIETLQLAILNDKWLQYNGLKTIFLNTQTKLELNPETKEKYNNNGRENGSDLAKKFSLVATDFFHFVLDFMDKVGPAGVCFLILAFFIFVLVFRK